MSEISTAFLFLTLFVLAGVMQVFWLRSRFFRRLAWPLDGGLTLGGKPLLGPNKTVAGFVGMVLFVTLSSFFSGMILQLWPPGFLASDYLPHSLKGWGVLGFYLGLAYMGAELPNSFVKRRWGIMPGELPQSRLARGAVMVIDQLDSVAGAVLMAVFVLPTGFVFAAVCLVVGPLIHWLFNLLLFQAGLKERAS